jgi:hypothetical protein
MLLNSIRSLPSFSLQVQNTILLRALILGVIVYPDYRLFPMDKMRLAKLKDDLTQKHDGRTIQFAALSGKRDQVPNRIPFGAPDEKRFVSEPDEGVNEEIENLPVWEEPLIFIF